MKAHMSGFGAFFSHSENNSPRAAFLGCFTFSRCPGEVIR